MVGSPLLLGLVVLLANAGAALSLSSSSACNDIASTAYTIGSKGFSIYYDVKTTNFVLTLAAHQVALLDTRADDRCDAWH